MPGDEPSRLRRMLSCNICNDNAANHKYGNGLWYPVLNLYLHKVADGELVAD
jgi:hypothetical protein